MIGETVGEYTLRERIGEGAMGTVYLAHHARLDQPAAIKVLSESLAADPLAVQRFLDEARAAARIRHRSVVRIIDCSVLENGRPYFVMELLDGETLASYIRRGGPADPVAAASRIGGDLALGLAAAHACAVVHRDLKPENIFLARDAETGDVMTKILDFGVAKLGQLGGLTRPGALLGTPSYMSPEQCHGGGTPVDQRSDIYSLACVLFELVSGRPPFLGDTLADLLVAHTSQQPPLLVSLGCDVPPAFEALLGRMLSKSPALRPARAGDVKVALDAWAPPETVTLAEIVYGERPSEAHPEGAAAGTSQIRTQGGGTRVLPQVDGDAPVADGPKPKTMVLGPERPFRRHTTLSAAAVDLGTLQGTGAGVPARRSGPARSTIVLASLAGATALAALVTGGVLQLGSRPRPQATTGDPAPAPSPPPAPRESERPRAPAVAPPPALPRRAPAAVAVKITSSPDGAEIWVEGERGRACQTPCSLSFPRGDRPVVLKARHGGYLDRSETVIPDRDYDIEMRLQPIPAPSTARPPASPPAARRPRATAPAARSGTNEELLGPRGF